MEPQIAIGARFARIHSHTCTFVISFVSGEKLTKITEIKFTHTRDLGAVSRPRMIYFLAVRIQ
jgi:hypothetical protein